MNLKESLNDEYRKGIYFDIAVFAVNFIVLLGVFINSVVL